MAGTFVWADLQAFDAGLEVWFGSTAGGQERGRRRLRSIGAAEAAGTMVCDWYDDIELSDDDYITIVHNYPAWPKYSWFTATGPEFRKDGPDGPEYGDTATDPDPNELPAPHVIMGRNYAGEMPGAGNLTISFDASNTVDVAGGGGGYTYAWDITPPTNASFDNDAIAAPTMTVTAAGKWWVHVTVTIDGRSTTAHRAVIVGGGITEFSRSPITTKWDSTHLECQITSTSPDSGGTEIRPEVDWSDFEDHALIIITAIDYYGTTQKTIDFRDDGVYDDRHHIVFSGYLLLENDDLLNTGTGQVQMSAVSLMDMFVYSLSLTGVDGADQWYEMDQDLMTVAGNLLHLFRWQSTLLDIADWWLPWSDTVLRSANEEFGEGDMIERARALCRARIMGMTLNPQGEVFVETDLNTRSAVDRGAATTTLILTDADVAEDKRVRIRRRGDVIRVLLDGGFSQGRMGTFQPYFSASQEVARAEGRPALVHLDRLMLPSQAEANRLSGRLAGVANRKFSEVNLDFSGNYREVFSPADQQWSDLGDTFASTLKANLREFSDLDDVLVVPRQVTHSHDNRTGYSSVSAIFDVEAPVELIGVTITPPEVPSEDPGDGGWDMPGPPDWPAIPEITYTGSLLAFDGAEGCWLRLPDAADWVERNGARTGTDDDDNQGGWDPHWFTPAKKNSTDPNQAILWACQVGKIWRSTDAGVSWLDVTPADDPPNSWNDGVAPTVAGLTFIQRTDNIHQNKAHYFLAEWQEAGGDWRGWLLITEDDGSTWTWAGLGATTDGTYYYPTAWHGQLNWQDVAFHPIPNTTNPCADWDPINDPSFSTGVADNIGTEFNFNFRHHNGYIGEGYIGWNMGASLTTNAAGSIEVRMIQPSTGVAKALTGNNQRVYVSTDGAVWVQAVAGRWDRLGAAYAWGPNLNIGVQTFRYIRLRYENSNWNAPRDWDFAIDAIRIGNVTGIDDIRPIWMDTDSEDGSTLWITLWRSDDTLAVQQRDTSTGALVAEYELGACTLAELNARTYWAAPYTPPFDKDTCYVFGRMNAPQALANPEHLIASTDGGTTWASVENGFGADYISAFRAEGDTTGDRQFYAVRAIAAAAAQLYQGHETLTYRIDLPFAVGVTAGVDALTVNPDGQVAVGADAAAANMIEITESPWASWTDITDSYPATGSVSSLTYL
jgi:hypothetical protein